MPKKNIPRELIPPKVSDSKRAANKKYMDSLSRVALWLTPEEKKELTARAVEEDKSLNAYIRNKLGLKDTPKKMVTTPEIVLAGGLDEKKMIAFCKELGYKYKSYQLSTGFERDQKWTAGALFAEDENGQSVPIPLTIDELESLRVQETDKETDHNFFADGEGNKQ